MKATIKGFITYRAPLWAGAEPKIEFYSYDPASYGDKKKVIVREHSFEVEVPDDFDPRPQMVANIEAEIDKTRAAFTARIAELQEQRQRLLAIECSA